MRHKLAALMAFLILFGTGIGIMAAELQPIAFTFVGRWQPSDDPVLIDDNGLQDIQNLRKSGKHFKGVGGHTLINATTVANYPYIINGYHFHKDRPQESHVMIVAADATNATASYVFQNTTAIPSAGDFTPTAVHIDAAGGIGNGRFSTAPNGNMIYTNGPETLIWGGDEIHPMSFISASTIMTGTTTTPTNAMDYTSQITNTRQTADQVAAIGGGIDTYTKMLLHADGLVDSSTTITDSSDTPKTVTSAGSAQIDTAQYKYAEGSILFDGDGDYVTTADHADFNMADDAFTFDFWLRFAALPGAGKSMVVFSQTSTTETTELTISGAAGYPTITTSGTKTIVTYTSSGTFVVPEGVNMVADVLVVAGGGGACGASGWKCCGGGGAGGMCEASSMAITSGSHAVVVGSGGTGGAFAATPTAGGDSTFNGITAVGGGTGGKGTGGDGGSGGGAYDGAGGGQGTQGDSGGATGYGNDGGDGYNDGIGGLYGGGGGGAGGAGASYPTSVKYGAGRSNSITGSAATYAQGGDVATGSAGTANTGNGGSGYWADGSAHNGGAGGSGVVILSYTTEDYPTVAAANTAGTGLTVSLNLTTSGSTVTPVTGTWSPSTNVWYHMGVIRGWGGSASGWAITVDGTAIGSATTTETYPDVPAAFKIGSGSAGTIAFNGWIDEFRVSKGVARWESAFTPWGIKYRTAANSWIVGFPRPVQGVKYYVSTPNAQTSTMTAQEWNGSSWTDLTITDNTSSSGISLAKTGTVTFSTTVNTAKQRYINGYSLYWYQFNISAGQASIYYVTGDAPMQEIRNIWSGRQAYATKALKYQTDYKDYTDSVNDDIDSTTMDLSSMPNTGYMLLGFTTPIQAVNITMEPESENSTASNALTVYYWGGNDWIQTSALSDGTGTTTKSLNKSGVVAWNSPGAGVEFSTAIGDETPLYYYKFAWAGTLDSDTKIGEIRGMEATNSMPTYELAVMYQNRLFLLNEYNGLKNKVIYSMDAAPDVFNGSDSGVFYIGDDTDITAAVTVYNVFSNTAYEQMIIGKKGEIYRLAGDGPEYWTVKRISENVGCVAPLSMVSVEITGEEKGQRRQVAIFQGDSGFYMTDGATVIPISDDIRCYFDPNDSRYIPTTRRTKTVSWYDPKTRAYKALISSGSTATYHNLELEYSLDTREWTKIYRENGSGADPLQSGWRVWDTDGLSYTYGANKTGQIYRLENGNTWAGTGITQYIHTKDLILDSVAPFFRKSTVKYMRTALKKKTNGGTVSIAHYGDQVLTVNATSNQVVPSAITVSTAPYNTQSCNLGPFLYHSFKLTASAATVSDGMELTGIGLWCEPYTAIR